MDRRDRVPLQRVYSLAVSCTFEPIGRVTSPFTATSQIPKGLGAEHRAEGVLEIDARFEDGLADIEGFSHLYVLWVFDRVEGVELTAWPPADDRPHGVFATRSPQRPNPIGLTVVERRTRRLPAARRRRRHARRHTDPGHQALPVERDTRRPSARLAGRSGNAPAG
jgi:tRNA-Thr(GGU) m(6)t(6)A37 methyltransferase TsaA